MPNGKNPANNFGGKDGKMEIEYIKRKIPLKFSKLNAVELSFSDTQSFLIIRCSRKYIIILKQDTLSGAMINETLDGTVDDLIWFLDAFNVKIDNKELKEKLKKLL